MSERKIWSETENTLLAKLFYQNQNRQIDQKLTWQQIANLLNQKCHTSRSGKQCRERWHNQLDPKVAVNIPWQKQEEDILFFEQTQHGNKWSQIAQKLPGRTDNNIKNYFYSTLRKAMRKVNLYMSLHKKQPMFKNTKQFPQQILSKILSVADENYQNKVTVFQQNAQSSAKQIKNQLVTLERDESIQISINANSFLVDLIHKIQQFNRICKKRKSKKKEDQEDDEEHQKEDRPLLQKKCQEQKKDPIQKSNKTHLIKKPTKRIKSSSKIKPKIMKLPSLKLGNEAEKGKQNPSSQQLSSSLRQSSSLQKSSSFRHSSFKQVVPGQNTLNKSQFFMQPPPHSLFPQLFAQQNEDLFTLSQIKPFGRKQSDKFDDIPIQFLKEESLIPNTSQTFNIFQKSVNYGKDFDSHKFGRMNSSTLFEDLHLGKRSSQRLQNKRSNIPK